MTLEQKAKAYDEALERAIIYLENRIEELVDFKATLKRMIKEE